jgi:lysophospholipase L1-like esterase
VLKETSVKRTFLPNNKKEYSVFLFQGDSITDGNRGRNNDPNHIMGHGYAFSIASRLGADFPEKKLQFYNRGISGNKITDLPARWQQDALELRPDVLSILVGVNDVNAIISSDETGSASRFEEEYRLLLDNTIRELPGCLLVLCEPFILPVGRVKEAWTKWSSEMKERQQSVRKLATDFKAVFIPLQEVFDRAAKEISPDYWIWDGIHPTVAGHELITREWLEQVGKQVTFIGK